MKMRINIDVAGRIVIPKRIRTALDLSPGDALELESADEKITLRPVSNLCPLAKEKGVWVFRTGQPLSVNVTDDLLEDIHYNRDNI